MFEFQKIVTKRLSIRKFQEDDVTDRYVSWLNDPETVRYSEQRHTAHSYETSMNYLAHVRKVGDWFLAIIQNETDIHIGNITVAFDHPNGVADMAIMIGEPAVRGKGYGLEAWTAVIDQLLNGAGIRKVTAGTMSVNRPMLAIARRSGMIEEGKQRRQYLLGVTEVDRVLFARFASKT